MRVPLLLALVVASLTTTARAQWVGDSANEARIHHGISYVYNFQFDSARFEFQQVIHSRPDHPAGYFFLAMVDWWRIITDLDNTSRDDEFIARLDKVIEIADSILDKDENNITALFYKGGAIGFEGRLYGNREDWVKAANEGRLALPLVRKMAELAPKNADVLLGIGIYNYYAAIIPDQYPFVKPFMIFFPKGDRLKGLEQLKLASEKATYANIEATYFLLQALQNFEKQAAQAQPLALRLHALFPNNVIFHKYVGRCSAALGQWAEMSATYREILDRVRAKRLGYDASAEREADYYLGLEAMNEERFEEALRYFFRSDELSRTLDRGSFSGFMTLTNLKIGMIYDAEGKRDLAVKQYDKVLNMKDYQDAHRLAEEFLKIPYKRS